jgi:hypothetical protein
MHEPRLMGGVRQAVAVVGVVFGVAVLSADVASADGPFQLTSRLGDFCLDAPSGDIYTDTVINPCNGTDFQRWNLTDTGELESVAFAGACLTVANTVWWITVQPCINSVAQHWTLQPNGLVTAALAGCLNVYGGPGPGTRESTFLCDADAPNQEWDVVR